MGDRVWMTMRVRRTDAEIVAKAFGVGVDDLEERNGEIFYEDTESNFGDLSIREALAKNGAVFEGMHEAGCEYAAYVFCAANGHHLEHTALGGGPIVAAVEYCDGIPDEASLKSAMAYFDLLKIVREEFAKEEVPNG